MIRLKPSEMQVGDVVEMDFLTEDHHIERKNLPIEKITHPMPQRYVVRIGGHNYSMGSRQTMAVVQRAGEES